MGNTYITIVHLVHCAMVEYYDYILGLIPLTIVGVTGLLSLAGIATSLAIFVGGGLTLPLVGHALFVRAPAQRPAQSTAGTDSAARTDGPTAAAD